MTVRRVMGTETEYAVSAPAVSHANPVQLSFDVIGAAADPERSRIRWDYRQEDPVNDARGTRLERAAARPDMLTDEPQLNIVNVIAGDHRPVRGGAVRPCRRPADAAGGRVGERGNGARHRPAPQQRRWQGRQLGHP